MIQAIAAAILNWLTSLVSQEAKEASQKVVDEKVNAEIEKAQETAKTTEAAQDAIDRLASRAGRDP